jgi:DNA-binding transcriptional LysR family regulator
MRRNDLVDLTVFIAVAEERSFTRAALKLGVSQSTLSHTVRRLEARLGFRLLTRTTRSVAPTYAGERLLARLVPSLAELDAEIASLAELRDTPSGTIRITTSKHAAITVIWPKLRTILGDYPDVHVELSLDAGLADVVSDRFDAGVRLGEALAKDMIAVPIGPELRMAAVGSPAYFECRPAPTVPHELAQHRCINQRTATAGDFYAWEFEKAGRDVRVRVEGQLAFNDEQIIVDAAMDGYGIAFVMEDYARQAIDDGRLVRVLGDWCPPFPGYHLYYPSRRQPSAAFTVVVAALRERPETV